MRILRRLAAACLLAALIAAGVGTAATAATQSPPELMCIPGAATSTHLSVRVTFANSGSALTAASGTLSVSWDGGDTWESVAPLNVSQGSWGNTVTLPGFFDGRPAWPALIEWESNLGTATCWAEHHPADASVTAPNMVAYGERVAIMAQFRLPTVPLISTLVADVYFDDNGDRRYLGSTKVTTWGQVALFTTTLTHTGRVEFELYDEASDPDHLYQWNVSDGVWIEVTHSAPYLEYNKTVVAGQRVNMRFWYGVPDDYYHAEIQRYNGSMWVATGTPGSTLGTSGADLSFVPSKSGTYRVYYWAAAKAYAPHTKSFTVTVLPKVSLAAASSVKKGTSVTFTVKHPLASTGSGKLQYYSGGTWKTAKTFSLSSTKTTKVTIKVTSTHKWRALVGGNASASRTVTAK